LLRAMRQAAKSTVTITIPTTIIISVVLSYFYNATVGTPYSDMVPYFIAAGAVNVGMFFVDVWIAMKKLDE